MRAGFVWKIGYPWLPMDQISIIHICFPSGYLTVRHGKFHPFLIGEPSISMGHLYHGYVKKPDGKMATT